MISLIDIDNKDLGYLLYDKYLPRVGDFIVQEGHSYEVLEVIFNDDEETVFLRVDSLINSRYGTIKYAGKEPPPDELEKVKRYVEAGQKLEAIKLYRDITGKGIKACKDYIDSL